MTEEDKMLERLARERKSVHGRKARMFNLADDDENGDGEILTHYGKVILCVW